MSACPKPRRPKRGGKLASAHMARVAEMPCVICGQPGPSIVHHAISGRFSQSRASDFETIPLCVAHHDATSPAGIHRSKAAWEALHGPDHAFIAAVTARIYGAAPSGE